MRAVNFLLVCAVYLFLCHLPWFPATVVNDCDNVGPLQHIGAIYPVKGDITHPPGIIAKLVNIFLQGLLTDPFGRLSGVIVFALPFSQRIHEPLITITLGNSLCQLV